MSEERVLGALQEFKETTLSRLDKLEDKVDKLHGWKLRFTGKIAGAAMILGLLVGATGMALEWFHK